MTKSKTRRPRKGPSSTDVHPEETPAPRPTVTVTRDNFQALHSAGRAMLDMLLQQENPEIEAVLVMEMLDAAIDEGHEVLNTDRGAADEYRSMVGGLLKLQFENARKFLEAEGLSIEQLQSMEISSTDPVA